MAGAHRNPAGAEAVQQAIYETAFRDKASTGEEKRARKSTANRILTVLKAILNKAFQDGMATTPLGGA